MCITPQYVRNGAAKRCAICGLIRRYSWRTALCSTKCAERFRTRREVTNGYVEQAAA
jgi:hypothetical protein